jgi:hypothetical protein
MNDFQPQEPTPEHNTTPAGTGTIGTPLPAPAKKSNRNVFIILVGALLVSLCCIGAIVGVAGLIGTGVFKVITEKPKVEFVIDEYMRAMADQDAKNAYTLFSTRAHRNISLADIEKFVSGNNYRVFEGYESIAMADFNLTLTSDPDPTMPQGLVAEVSGMISYADGFTGDFSAVLEKEGDEWRLYGINVNAPADKFSQ